MNACNANSQKTSLTDARGFLAEMKWDAFDRQQRCVFPSRSTHGVADQSGKESTYIPEGLSDRTKEKVMTKWSLSFFLIFLAGCAGENLKKRPNNDISDFAHLSSQVGNHVILDGYLSSAHEGEGLYFKRSDLKLLNSRCAAVSPLLSSQHGSRVRVAGKLVESECSSERICITACGRYKLLRP